MATAAAQEPGFDDPRHPRRTLSLIGHGAAEATLTRAAISGRLPHAWLICGPQGIGKATLAHRFARFMLAGRAEDAQESLLGPETGMAAPENLDVPPEHSAVRLALEGAHPNLRCLEPGWDPKAKRIRADITVDDVRTLHPFFGMTAAQGAWRIAVVDSADALNRNAANALLKLLEEPPAKTLLLLVAHAPDRLLATIRSRCTRLTLRPLDSEDMRRVLADQDVLISPEDAPAVAALAGGSPGRAIALIESGGLETYRAVLGLMENMPGLDPKALHGLGDRLGAKGADEAFRLFATLTENLLARLARFKATGGAENSSLPPREAALFAALGARASLDQWFALWEKMRELFGRTEAVNLDRKQAVLIAFSRLQKLVT